MNKKLNYNGEKIHAEWFRSKYSKRKRLVGEINFEINREFELEFNRVFANYIDCENSIKICFVI